MRTVGNMSIKALGRGIISAVILITMLFAAGAAAAEEKALKKVSFIPQWLPQAQFAGYYVALEKGIYKKYGLDVAVITGGPDAPSSEYLKSGKADFATMWLSTAIQMRARGVRVLNIAQMLQRSALMLIAKKSRGINSPRDMNGKKVGLWGADFQIQPKAFFMKNNIDAKVIPLTSSINLFLRDAVDVTSAMWYNEYHIILNSGINTEELTAFFFHEYGLNFPEDGIYVMEETFQNNPSESCAFVKASIEGWQYAFSHPEEALDIVMKYMRSAHRPSSRVHQRWMLETMKDLTMPAKNNVPIGALGSEDYGLVSGVLKSEGLIDSIPPFESFYKDCAGYDKK
jgi:NitT/TauT family transport system substrate-binding protein